MQRSRACIHLLLTPIGWTLLPKCQFSCGYACPPRSEHPQHWEKYPGAESGKTQSSLWRCVASYTGWGWVCMKFSTAADKGISSGITRYSVSLSPRGTRYKPQSGVGYQQCQSSFWVSVEDLYFNIPCMKQIIIPEFKAGCHRSGMENKYNKCYRRLLDSLKHLYYITRQMWIILTCQGVCILNAWGYWEDEKK